MIYQLRLTGDEVKALAWLTDRGYFPELLFDEMSTNDEYPEDRHIESVYDIPEHTAWSLLELRDNDPDAYLACLGEPLLSKVIELEQKII